MGTYEALKNRIVDLENEIGRCEEAYAIGRSLKAEIQNAKELQKQLIEKYAEKYGLIEEAEIRHYTLAELESIRKELADTSLLTLIKRFLGIGKKTEEIYADLMGKIIGLLAYLTEKLNRHKENYLALKSELYDSAVSYEKEYTNICRIAGFFGDVDWGRYKESKTALGEIYVGDIAYSLTVPVTYMGKELLEWMPYSFFLEEGYAAGGNIRLPYTRSLEKPIHFLYEFKKEFNTIAVQSMKSLVYQMVRLAPEHYIELHLMDGENTGSDFRELMNLQKVREGELVDLNRRVTGGTYRLAQTYLEDRQISDGLKELEQHMSRVAEEMGRHEHLWQYNAENTGNNSGKGLIPYQIVVIENFPIGFSDEDIKLLDKLIKNGPNRGISTIILNNQDKWTSLKKNYSYEKDVSIYSKISRESLDTLDSIHINQQFSSIVAQECQAQCSLQLMHDSYPDYIDSVVAVKNAIKETDNYFPHVIDTESPYGMKTSENGLRIPFAIDRKGKVMEYCLGEALNAHGLISGGTGSGKSTLLHMLISSIVMNYSPKDVEIWLSDYKITEFYSYKTNTPPHIRFIGLSKTSDFSYAFIDKITDEMNRRQSLIAMADLNMKTQGKKVNITNFNDYRKVYGVTSMTRLLVIIDEFHVMAQHARMEPEYKTKLENLLAEARALGIILLFSDQAIRDGLEGLTDKAKKQIKARLALANSKDELEETLGERDKEKLKPFFNMKRGEVAMQTFVEVRDEDGVLTEEPQIEKGMVIHIDGEWRYIVSEKSRKVYNAEDYVSDSFDDRVVEAANWDDIKQWEETSLKPHRHGDKDLQIYLGKPIDLKFSMNFPLLQRKGNNIMSIAGSEDQQMQIFKSVVESFAHQENYEIVVMTDPFASLYREFYVEIEDLANSVDHMTIYKDLEDICYQVNKLLSVVEKRNNQKKIMVIWLGLDCIAELLAEESPKKPDVLEQMLKSDDKNQKNKAKEQKSSIKKQDELEAMFNNMFAEFGLFEEDDDPYAEIEDDANESDDFEESYLYNACDDIAKILHTGPSRNVYNYVVYDTSAALKDFRGARVTDFVHKIAFCMSEDDASDFLGSSRMIRELPENLGFYYNGRFGKKFVPYKL